MAARRTRPPQPLAPNGLPGHLVGFVEALRAQGISVGPSETVDAGQVLSVLDLGDRQSVREGLSCPVLRRPAHPTAAHSRARQRRSAGTPRRPDARRAARAPWRPSPALPASRRAALFPALDPGGGPLCRAQGQRPPRPEMELPQGEGQGQQPDAGQQLCPGGSVLRTKAPAA